MIQKNIILIKKYRILFCVILFFLPVVYLFFQIIYNSINIKKDVYFSHFSDFFHEFIFAELIVIGAILYVKYSDFIKRSIKESLTLCFVGAVIFLIYFVEMTFIEIKLNSVYFFLFLCAIYLELFPLFILRLFVKGIFSFFFYSLSCFLVILLNILLAIYLYYAGEVSEPTIFSNINIHSIRGFFLSYKLFEIFSLFFVAFLAIIFFILVAKRSEAIFTKKKRIKFLKAICILGFLHTCYYALYFSEKYTVAKRWTLYRLKINSENKFFGKVTANSYYTFAKIFTDFLLDETITEEKIYFSLNAEDINTLTDMGLVNQNNAENTFQKSYSKNAVTNRLATQQQRAVLI